VGEIRALIVDDEPLARRGIRQMLAGEPGVVVVGECRDGLEALRALDALAPDLVFLDVQMPELDGFGVIRVHGVQRMPAIVFVTAHDEFAVRAFETQALDYLVKPLHAARFAATMARVRERHRLGAVRTLAAQLHSLLGLVDGEPAPLDDQRIVVPTATGTVVIDVEAIDWIEAEDYYVRVYAAGEQYLVRDSLTALERRLDARQFVRIHRRAIVRLDRVREVQTSDTGETLAVLRDGTRIPVSRRRGAAFTRRLRGV
jgi:two-component system, LytTR family, response regulator